MTADEAIESVKAAMAFTGDTVAVGVNTDALRALLAEIERRGAECDAMRARVAELEGKHRVRAFAAQYQGGTIAHGTVTEIERGTWERMELPEFGVVRAQLEAEGWRVVPVTIEWSEEDGDADE